MPHSDRTGAGGAAIPTPFLVLGMLVAGCANSLLTKYQDMQCVSGCAKGSLSKRENFEQPVWQSLNMFVGEALCLIVIAVRHLSSKRSGDVRKDVGYTALAQDEDDNEQQDMPSPTGRPLTAASRLLFAIPSLCDMAGTTAMNVGLILVPVSVYQMSRGALVLWVGVLSVIFLHRKLRAHQWAALVAVVAGVALVGLAGSLAQKAPASATHQSLALLRRAAVAVAEAIDPEDPLRVIAGVLLITGAQIFTATQFVVEEKILSVYHVEPLEAVGLEGAAGLILVLLAMPILHVTLASRSGYFDIPLGFHQIISNGVILGLSFAICISIAIFNLTGIAITRRVSAAARSTIDTSRTLGIWAVSLALGWERLMWPQSVLQVSGFALLVYGTLTFNGIIRPLPFLAPKDTHGEGGAVALPLPDEEALARTAELPAEQAAGRVGADVLPDGETQGAHGRR